MPRHNGQLITAERARELLHYCPETGIIRWAVDVRKVRAGDEAGTFRAGRNCWYRQICVDYRLYPAHRIAWLITHGRWPCGEIDHIDGDGTNNRLANLRDVSRSGNARNMQLPRNNTSGHVGVRWHTRAGKWVAKIEVNGKTLHLGLYRDISGAVAARRAAEVAHGFHRNHGRAA